VEQHEAIALIGAGVNKAGGVWADLGAGSGVFTQALAALIGSSGTVYAVDRNVASLRDVSRSGNRGDIAEILTVVGDFTQPLDLPTLDGVVLANALHYVPYADQSAVMRRVASMVVAGGPIVVVEYDRRSANQWVPYPISPDELTTLASTAGLDPPVVLATQPSQYTGTIYSALVRTRS